MKLDAKTIAAGVIVAVLANLLTDYLRRRMAAKQ